MNAPSPFREFTPEQGKEYIALQVRIARLMMSIGTIKDPAEYVNRVAGIFEMIIKGELKLATDDEITEMRNQVEALVSKNRPSA